jgi:hypothetical protein
MRPRGGSHRIDPVIRDEEDTVILAVRLKSGRFESSIECPLFASDKERQNFVDAWLKMMEAGLKMGRSNRENRPNPVSSSSPSAAEQD